jgi:hypothetical protein
MFYEIIYGSEEANKVRASLRALLQEKVKSTKEELTKKSGEIVAAIHFGKRAKEGGTQWKAIVDMLKVDNRRYTHSSPDPVPFFGFFTQYFLGLHPGEPSQTPNI